jgi:Zn-dependent M28 family amino/carboxypeptidase
VFVEHAPLDLRNVVLAINLDMVGRLTDSRLVVHGADGRRRSLALTANTAPRLSLMMTQQSSGRSDDYSFARVGVPAMHITTGDHADYHRATDTAARVDIAGVARVTDYTERLVRLAADGR